MQCAAYYGNCLNIHYANSGNLCINKLEEISYNLFLFNIWNPKTERLKEKEVGIEDEDMFIAN